MKFDIYFYFDERVLQGMTFACVLHRATIKLKCSETLNIIHYWQEMIKLWPLSMGEEEE